MNKFKTLLFIVISFMVVLNFTYVLAAEQPGGIIGRGASSGNLEDPFQNKTIFTIIQNIIGYLIKIGAPILAVMVIYGGFLILSAGDSPEKVKSGRDVILWAVVGYTVVLCSWGIIYIMGEIITGKQDAFINKLN